MSSAWACRRDASGDDGRGDDAQAPGRRVLPRRTVRLRLTALYGVLFLVSGAVLLAIAGGVVVSALAVSRPGRPGRSAAVRAGRAQVRIQHCSTSWRTQAKAVINGISARPAVGSAVALAIMTVVSVAWAGSWPAGCCARCGR